MDAASVKELHIESSSRCNARCSSCGRSDFGREVWPSIVIQDLDPARLLEVLDMFPNLTAMQFCGNAGDPIAAKNVIEHMGIAVEKALRNDCMIQIHTNGSLRSRAWWRNLAEVLAPAKHEVLFALDGLEDTHHIYRQGTSFTKVIENAKSFIAAGGTAVWQFIPFKHNQHQILDCLRMSQDLGFRRFLLVKMARVPERTWDVKSRSFIHLSPWDRDRDVNPNRSPYREIKDQVLPEHCFHLQQSSVFLNVDGTISSCCHQGLHRRSSNVTELPDVVSEFSNNPHIICLEKCGSRANIG
jgi:sulfatase maturation enzyme AslB (radical SAM superfamily)